jgi:hypothetical protein
LHSVHTFTTDEWFQSFKSSLNMTLQTLEYVNPIEDWICMKITFMHAPPHSSEVLVYLARPSGFRPCISDGE